MSALMVRAYFWSGYQLNINLELMLKSCLWNRRDRQGLMLSEYFFIRVLEENIIKL